MPGKNDYAPIECPEITLDEVTEAIRKTKAGKAPGESGIPNQILHLCQAYLAPRLVEIMNASLRLGMYPRQWKTSITVALRKPGKGDYTIPQNYRPIALLDTIGKVMESVIASRLAYWVETHSLLPDSHIGGRKSRGVEHGLHVLMERIFTGINTKISSRERACGSKAKKMVVSLLMLDVSGAFDNVSHQRLIHNLKKRGVPPATVAWITDFLQDRETVIKLPEFTSSKIKTPTGIPQGSPLSPILYLFYNADLIQDLAQDNTCKTMGWIDDVGILVVGNSAEENSRQLELEVAKAERWAKAHASVFAPDKFAIQHFSKDKAQDISAPITIRNVVKEPKDSIRVLGVWFDSRLTFLPHLAKIEDTATKRLGAFSSITNSTWGYTVTDMRKVYQGAIVPAIFFGSSIWYAAVYGHGNKGFQDKMTKTLERIQKRAATLISGTFKTTAGAALEVELYLPPVNLLINKLNSEALIRIMGSPVEHLIYEERSPGKRTARLQTPLQHMTTQAATILDPLLMTDHLGAMEPKDPFIVPPWWEKPAVIIHEDRKTAIREHNITVLSSGPHVQNIYTDGSGLDGLVGAAAVQFDPLFSERPYYTDHCIRKAKKECLGTLQNTTVFAGELRGIDMALDFPVRDHPTLPPVLHIWTDNQASLRRVRDPQVCSGQHILRSIIHKIDMLRAQGVIVRFFWCPAHEGVPGNEAADEAAKQAGKLDPSPQMILRSAVKMQVKAQLALRWNKQWEAASHGRITFLLQKVPHKAVLKKFSSLTKPQCSILIQARTGKIALNSYLWKIGRSDTPLCRHGCGVPETPRHVIIDCPNYEDLRDEIFGLCRDKAFSDKSQIFNSPAIVPKTTNFLLHTHVLGQFRSLLSDELDE